MKKQNERENKSRFESAKDRRFYLYTVIGCAVILLSLIIVAIAISLGGGNDPSVNVGTSGGQQNSASAGDGNSSGGGSSGNDKPVDGTQGENNLPVANVDLINDFGFYYNQTLNCYYEHVGMDFAAEAGTAVMAMQSGVVESIYRDDLLTGTEIVLDHGDGLKSVYRFVEVEEGLQVGDTVEAGEQIAVVAAATGNEYKEGAHLHFEIVKNDKNVDPATYLTLEEK